MKKYLAFGIFLNFLLLPTAYSNDDENIGVIVGIVIGAVILVSLLICIFVLYIYCNYKKLRPHTWPSDTNIDESMHLPKADQLESSGSFLITTNTSMRDSISDGSYASGGPELSLMFANANAPKHAHDILAKLDFPKTSICLIKDIGTWTLGMVYQGEATGIKETELSTTVLVKSLHERASRKLKERFLSEMKWAVEFNHPNIITLLGTCVKNEPLYLIFEYLDFGPLNTFLQSVSSISTDFNMLTFDDVEDPETSSQRMNVSGAQSTLKRAQNTLGRRRQSNVTTEMLSTEDLFAFAIQVAAGMEHIASKGFVHKDLAARNCHVSQRLQVKIANFGFSKDINSPDYYHMQSPKTLIPVRWLAPECLKEGKYNMPTDVWAYGVLVWEIFAYGRQPYAGLSDVEAYNCITTLQLLEKPKECTEALYQLMQQCWSKEPPFRPSFNDIIVSLKDMQRSGDTPNVSFESTDLAKLATKL